MTQAIYQQVVQLVDQLSQAEQQALATHLQELKQQTSLSTEEWLAQLRQVQVAVPVGPNYSDRREDWYDDDGR